jgi:hypothetical protein
MLRQSHKTQTSQHRLRVGFEAALRKRWSVRWIGRFPIPRSLIMFKFDIATMGSDRESRDGFSITYTNGSRVMSRRLFLPISLEYNRPTKGDRKKRVREWVVRPTVYENAKQRVEAHRPGENAALVWHANGTGGDLVNSYVVDGKL